MPLVRPSPRLILSTFMSLTNNPRNNPRHNSTHPHPPRPPKTRGSIEKLSKQRQATNQRVRAEQEEVLRRSQRLPTKKVFGSNKLASFDESETAKTLTGSLAELDPDKLKKHIDIEMTKSDAPKAGATIDPAAHVSAVKTNIKNESSILCPTK